MPHRTCTFDGCERKHKGHGLCGGHYCQQRAGSKLRPLGGPTRAEQLQALIAIETDGCILVPWHPDRAAPAVKLAGATLSVGAAALVMAGRPRPEGMDCCHDPAICNNGRCCNPRHLRWDTRQANMADKIIAGTVTRRYGERSPQAKLTEAAVREIRSLAAAGQLTQTEIGGRYGVGRENVSKIKLGKVWGWLDSPENSPGEPRRSERSDGAPGAMYRTEGPRGPQSGCTTALIGSERR